MGYNEIVATWKSQKIDSVSKLDEALSNFRIIFAYHSGVIENPEITYHNTREIFENGKVINFTGEVRTVFEMQNQKSCYDYLAPMIVQKADITPELIKRIHLELMSGAMEERRWERGERPGQYKIHDYVVADDQGALPEEVSGEIEELCEEVQDVPDKGENVFKAAAYLHCKFENIHPFADGNGRVGRTLMNYFLMIHDYPPLVVYNETKDRYYEALGHYDRTGDIGLFVAYLKEALEQSWNRKLVKEIQLEQFGIER